MIDTKGKLVNTISHKNKQQGLVLLVTMLALIIMMLASVALIRSTDANLQIAGNMAFKRDLVNQGERAIPRIRQLFNAGVLGNVGQRYQDKPGSNYYATVLPSNNSGVPLNLINGNIAPVNNFVDANADIIISYVIDRMCLSAGAPDDPINKGACILAEGNGGPGGMGEEEITRSFPVYRMTLRINGPRNTEAFLQTTYTDS